MIILEHVGESLDMNGVVGWNRQTIEKFLQSWLRHKPESVGLQLSSEGWARISDLVAAFENQGIDVSKETLESIIRTDSKRKFEMEGEKVRARYGYSIKFETKPHPGMPPAVLYHALPARFVPRVLEFGIKPIKRQFVHLSPERKDAMEISGHAKSPSILLHIAAHKAYESGVAFYPRGKGVWLSEEIPAEFVTVYQAPKNTPSVKSQTSPAVKGRAPELRSRRKGMGFLKKPHDYDR